MTKRLDEYRQLLRDAGCDEAEIEQIVGKLEQDLREQFGDRQEKSSDLASELHRDRLLFQLLASAPEKIPDCVGFLKRRADELDTVLNSTAD